ncbi:MAG: histidine phosphatase family protein [archaeon]
MKLILIRHGETIENKKGILMGQLHGTLSDEGIEQAKKVAKRLKDEKIDAIYSSDLTRSLETAKEVIKYHQDIPMHIVKDLRERNFGELQGKTKIEIDWKWYMASDKRIPNGETNEEIYQRAKKFLDKIIHEHKNDTVLFVCHGGIGKFLIGVITNKKPDEVKDLESLENTSISIFEISENKKHKIHLFNDIEHLKI